MDAFGKKTLFGKASASAVRACLVFQGFKRRNRPSVSVNNGPLLFRSAVGTGALRSKFFEAISRTADGPFGEGAKIRMIY